MKRARKFKGNQVIASAVWIASGMTLVACSKGDTVNHGNNQVTPVKGCGTLSVTEAAELAATRLEHLGTVGLASLAGLENSRAAGRLLSFGNETMVDTFVSESQADLHDGLTDFKDDYLTAADVETSTESSVTFLLDPQKLCEGNASGASPGFGTGGSQATGGATVDIDQSCVSERTAHPMRVRISRIACDQGDNVAVEFLFGPQADRVFLAELYSERSEIEFDLGALLRNGYSGSSSSSAGPNIVGAGGSTPVVTRTEKPLVTAAVGVIHGTLTLTGTNQANGRASVTQAIDFTANNDDATRFRLEAGTDVATVSADGAAKTIELIASVGALNVTTSFKAFIRTFFDLSTTTAGASQQPVAFSVPGLKGNVRLDGVGDTITADGLQIVNNAATATQAGRTLLTISAGGGGPIAAVFAGRADDNFGLALANQSALSIHYELEPVMSAVEYPADYLASDTFAFVAQPGTSMTLMKESTSNDLAVVSSQTGQLLRVDSGGLDIRSSVWPSDSVSVQSQQCLARTVVSQTGHNDLLDDFTVGACSQ